MAEDEGLSQKHPGYREHGEHHENTLNDGLKGGKGNFASVRMFGGGGFKLFK